MFKSQSRRGLFYRWVALSGLVTTLTVLVPALAQNNPLTLAPGFRPDPLRVLKGKTGGSKSIASIAGVQDTIQAKCRGFANPQPSYTIVLAKDFQSLDLLTYSKNINDDLTMLLKGPNGLIICADGENQGRYPQISTQTMRRPFREGTYQIWIGSGEANKSIDYTLSASERPQR